MKSNILKPSALLSINDQTSIPLFIESLSNYGYAVTSVKSLEELFDQYVTNKFDIVILTNLGISAYSIIDYVEKLKIYDSKVNILVLSGHDDADFIASLASSSVETFFKLPIDFEELNSHIQFLLKHR